VKAQTIELKESTGRILCCAIFRQGGKKLLAKGHVLNEEDVRVLKTEGLNEVWVTELEAGEVDEDQAVTQVSTEIGCGSLQIRLAAGGRANLFTTEDCCVLVDDELLRAINMTASIAICTTPNFSFAKSGQRIASVKSAPFAVPQDQLDTVIAILRDRGPILQARPIRCPAIAVLYTDPIHGERARQLFEPVMLQRLQHFGVRPSLALAVTEDEAAVARGLQHLFRTKPAAILVASTTAPAGPNDAVGRGMEAAGCQLERFLAPVEPGNLLLLAYKDEIPVLSAPGCFRSAKPNVVDVILPPMLARYRVSGWEIACLGHGGLLG
jgi:molybdenum cofactor cytidylyltransferase